MKKNFMSAIVCVFLLAFAASPAAAQPAEGYDPADGIYVKAEKDYYWNGRYSDGRVFAEYIANELTGSYNNLTNYAVGGAFTGVLVGTAGEENERSNWSTWLKGWSGVQQTEHFLNDVNNQADPKALYIISTGGNDAYTVGELGDEKAAELASDATLTMVKNLAENGAKYILLPNRFKDSRTQLTEFADLRNQQVVEKIDNYLALHSTPDDVTVIYGDSGRLKDNIDEQGFEKFGYKSMGFYLISDWVPAYGYALAAEDNSAQFPVKDPLEGYGVYSTDSKYYTPEAAGWKPDEFYTYDEYHLSSRSHKHLATYLLDAAIETEDGEFQKVYDGEASDFAKALADERIPSSYSKVFTFGDSSIDSGRGLEVTEGLVKNRQISAASSYIVKRGDNLWNIAKAHYGGSLTNTQIASLTDAIFSANREQIRNPNLIYPGQTFELPEWNQ